MTFYGLTRDDKGSVFDLLHVLEPIGKAVTEKVGTRDFAGATFLRVLWWMDKALIRTNLALITTDTA